MPVLHFKMHSHRRKNLWHLKFEMTGSKNVFGGFHSGVDADVTF